MAKIIKVGSQNITPNKIANPFRTSRNSTTNPFKYNNFEGTTLPLELAADVFAGTKTEKPNRLKMIATSVTGSMNKMRSSIAEPIVNFVKRVYTGTRDGVAAAWNLTFRTPISEVPGFKQIPGIKQFDDVMSKEVTLPSIKAIGKGMVDSISEGISSQMNYLKKDVREVGHDMKQGIHTLGEGLSARWEALAAKLPSRTRYTENTPVPELETAWKEIIALEGGIA